jgi:RNA polymerase sigma-54 factor
VKFGFSYWGWQVALDIRQSQKLTQQLLMTPQLQQAIKLLQLSRLELEQYVVQQLSENPILEESVADSGEDNFADKEQERTAEDLIREQINVLANSFDSNADPGDAGKNEEIDWEAMSRLREQGQQATSKASSSDEAPNYENILSSSLTLQDFLLKQIGEQDLDSEEQRVAQLIIGNIDDKGYFLASLEEIVAQEGITFDFAEDILDVVQRLEPPGVGARDLKECLLIQIRNSGLKNGIVEKIVAENMHELETRNYNAIAKSRKISLDAVIENVAIIAKLDPIPGRQFGGETTQVIIPDIYIFKLGGEWVLSLNEDGIPRLKVNEFYKTMMAERVKGEDKEYIQEKLKSAQWLIKSIHQRQKTIFKVTESILSRQKDFFEKGIQFLKPMILKDVADEIGMHESTVSRVTNNKYIHTPRGIFELKYFFNSSVSRSDGDDMASESVKRMIKDIVVAEDAKKPFSDQKIVSFLEKKGIHLARRTVAKYREQLGILPSSKRKKYF